MKRRNVYGSSGDKISSYIAALSSAEPSPGGGSAAAFAAALGAACALKAMVFTSLEKIPARSRRRFRAASAVLGKSLGAFKRAVVADARAYSAAASARKAVGRASSLSLKRRAVRRLAVALLRAASVPDGVAVGARACLREISAVKNILNKN
ncbi:MAG: cyclodeaminase/cyclohydrolase family protein, partial [Endomicrobiia bacterium]|nr:cyclodeaminase/cyclohydrolase family protein [Endomicrobiia bacterium]